MARDESNKIELPAIPAKRYFTIGEVSELCAVKPHVLRYWEQEFTQLKPVKRRGNRRYYQHHEVLLIRRIRELLYEQGFTISGARNRLAESPQRPALERMAAELNPAIPQPPFLSVQPQAPDALDVKLNLSDLHSVRQHLEQALQCLRGPRKSD